MTVQKSKHVLPDSLRPGLKVVFVGTAAGTYSAEAKAYYANPRNKFWRTLDEVGITPRRYQPAEYSKLLKLGIGFTDVCKIESGNDNQVRAYDVEEFDAKIERCAPLFVAFTSKRAASAWLRTPTKKIGYGLQKNSSWTRTRTFVLPSPSGSASGHWQRAPWKMLARHIEN